MDLKNRNIQLLILIVFVGLAFRLYNLDASSIRADEGGSLYLAQRPIDQIITAPQDVQPPFYYVLLNIWSAVLGNSEFVLRLLPVIFSVLTIPLIYFAGRDFFNDEVGLFSALIFAFSQANIRFAQNLRNYSLITFFALLSIYFFYLYLQKPDKKYLLVFIISSALAVYSHYFVSLILVAEFAYLILAYKKYKQVFLKTFAAFIVIFILLTPLMPSFLSQTSIKTGIEKPLFESDPLTKISLTSLDQNNMFVRISLIYYHFSVGFLEFNAKDPIFLAVLLLAAIVYGISILGAFKSLFAEEKGKLTYLLTLLLVPTVLLSVLWLSKLIPPLTYTRYLLYISPVYYILVLAGIFVGLPKITLFKNSSLLKTISLLFVMLIFSFNLISLSVYYKEDFKKEDWRSGVSLINSKSLPNETIAIYSGAYSYNLKYYLTKKHPIYTIPNNFPIDGKSFSDVYSSSGVVTQENSCNVLKLSNNKTRGIWYVYAAPQIPPDKDLVKKCLDSNLTLADNFESSYKTSGGQKVVDLLIYHYVKVAE